MYYRHTVWYKDKILTHKLIIICKLTITMYMCKSQFILHTCVYIRDTKRLTYACILSSAPQATSCRAHAPVHAHAWTTALTLELAPPAQCWHYFLHPPLLPRAQSRECPQLCAQARSCACACVKLRCGRSCADMSERENREDSHAY